MNALHPQLQKISSIKTLCYGSADASAPTVVIFHGFGANAYDLFSLGEAMDPQGRLRWYFPDGILTVPIGPGYTGKAWFPIDQMAFERAMASGQGVNYSDVRPRGLDEAKDRILGFLQEIQLQPRNSVLGGFSQGSMLAVELAKQLPSELAGLLLFSGALVDQTGFVGHEDRFKGLRTFQSHGEQDAILPFSGAENLKRQLSKMGAKVQWNPFFGGHEIPFEVIAQAKTTLQKIFKY